MAISIAMVALSGGAKVSVSAMRRDLNETWPELPPAGKVEKRESTFAFAVGDADVIVGHMPAPIPWGDLEGPCATTWIWPDAAKALRPHRTHLIVTVAGPPDPVERARLLTRVVASILAATEGAAGVYWGDGGLVISPPVFRDFATQVLPDGPPVHVWVNFRVGRNDAGSTSGFTTGLAALGHMEIETANSPEPPNVLRERLIAIAGYLIETGPVIRDGDTLGEDADEKIRVTYSPSEFGNPGRVLRLDYGGAARKRRKPW